MKCNESNIQWQCIAWRKIGQDGIIAAMSTAAPPKQKHPQLQRLGDAIRARRKELGFSQEAFADVVGLDVCAAVGQVVGGKEALANAPKRLAAKLEAKELGKKTGRGFYTWVDGKPQKSAAGAVPPGLSERLIAPMLAEANKALAEGVVENDALGDAGAIFGCGFAPFTGGPFNYQRAQGNSAA